MFSRNFFGTVVEPLNILIVQPNLYNYTLYLPYVWACLKTYSDQFSDLKEAYQWLEPIYYNDDPVVMIRPYENVAIDVIGLSCYTWNFAKNIRIAAALKQLHPKALVVAGGPEPDIRDPEFFAKYPVIDLVVRQDGEAIFSEILRRHLHGGQEWSDLPNVLTPNRLMIDGAGISPREEKKKARRDLFREFAHSPYLAQKQDMHRMIQDHKEKRGGDVRIFWETNRGCPYSCAFCDWGSSTFSRVRLFPVERLDAELDWIADAKIHSLLITDANFGIHPRDLDLTEKLIRSKESKGFPQKVYYSVAKNNVERVIQITRRLFVSGLTDYHTMSIQHTDPEVLAAMDRQTLPIDAQIKIQQGLTTSGIPIVLQMILGAPGDTPEKWRGALTDAMEWGVHEEFRIFPYNLLPNAPAADPEFIAKWNIQTIGRYTHMNRRSRDLPMHAQSKTAYVIASRSYTREAWVEMYLFSIFIQAFHGSGVSRLIAIFLRHHHCLSYRFFYEGLWDKIRRGGGCAEIIRSCEEHLRNFLAYEDALEEIAIPMLSDARVLYSLEEYLLFHLLIQEDILWADLDTYLRSLGEMEGLASAVAYQKTALITPDFDSRKGRSLRSETDWPRYFSQIENGRHDERQLYPNCSRTPVLICFQDRATGVRAEYPLDWWRYPRETFRWYQRFFDCVVGVNLKRFHRNLLREISIESGTSGFPSPMDRVAKMGCGLDSQPAIDLSPPDSSL